MVCCLESRILHFRGWGTPELHPGAFSAVPAGLIVRSYLNPGLTSWATLSRPCGTQLARVVLTQDSLGLGFSVACLAQWREYSNRPPERMTTI